MSATQQSDRTDNDPSGTTAQRFRAPTVEEALQRARELLGDDAEIIEANRIRRGGIGGFFATELGVEVLAQSPGSRAQDTPAGPRRGDEYEIRPSQGSVRSSGVHGVSTEPTPAIDLAASPSLGRAAWRAATGTGGRPLGEEQLTAPLLAALIEQATTEEQRDRSGRAADRPPRVFRPWKAVDGSQGVTSPAIADAERIAADLVADGPTEQSATPGTDPVTGDAGSFAEHFLRELMSDAEALRHKPGRNRSLPEARPEALPGLAGDDEAAAPAAAPRRRQATQSGPTRQTGPTRQAPKRRRVQETELPLMPAPATATASIDAVATPVGDPRTAALTAIVDQCVQLASTGDRSTAPTKVALAMTMADGALVKLTVELPRSR